jgi:nucleotide-binding universal stress UspA family protein
VPLDGSEFARAAVTPAAACAKSMGLRLHALGIARNEGEFAWVYDHVRDTASDIFDIEVIVEPNPVDRLLRLGAEPGNLLCFASHDRRPVAARVMHSVGSALIERADYPIMVVGPDVHVDDRGRDVVVAIDGVSDPRPLVEVAAAWARAIGTPLRIVTVYEPVTADLRRPDHYTRHHGPSTDPEVYLASVQAELAPTAATVAIADPVSVAAGLVDHLASDPAQVLVLGRHHRSPALGTRTAADVLRRSTLPLLIVNHT